MSIFLFLITVLLLPKKTLSADFLSDNFLAGIALKDAWSPGWGEAYGASTLEALKDSAARWISLHFFYSYSSTATPVIESSYASEGYSTNQEKVLEHKEFIRQAKNRGYKVLLITSLYFGNMLGELNPGEETALNNSVYDVHDSTWFGNWFSYYRNCLREIAAIAEETGTDMIALTWGTDYIVEDNRNGYDTTTKWKEIIAELRTKYNGKITLFTVSDWAAPDIGKINFWDALDYIGVHLVGGVAQYSGTSSPSLTQVSDAFQTMFSTLNLNGYSQALGKKVILATTYSSSDKCYTGEWFEEFEPQPNILKDFSAQEKVYQGLFVALSTPSWIGGIFPWGYWWKDTFYNNTEGDAAFDKGPSVRNKPAEEVIRSYYQINTKTLSVLTTCTYQTTLVPKTGMITLSIPEGIFTQNVNLTASTFTLTDFPDRSESGTANPLNIGLEINTDPAIQPNKGMVITINYRDSDLSGVSDESRLRIGFLDQTANIFQTLPTTVYCAENIAVSTVSHLSKFSLFEQVPITANDQIIAFPNPFYPGKVDILTLKYLPSTATIKIYNLSGELVKELNYFGTGETTWDGKNASGKDVASGVYLLTINTDYGKKIIKVALLR